MLQFEIELHKPGYLRISFVHGSDEFPRFQTSDFNDSPLVFVGDESGNNMENFILFKVGPNFPMAGTLQTLSLGALDECGLLIGNLVAPEPANYLPNPGSGHGAIPTPRLHYDHEFGGFTEKLTRETTCVYPPGKYTIKIVIQDVLDRELDSGTFFEEDSLKLYSFDTADLNLDGYV